MAPQLEPLRGARAVPGDDRLQLVPVRLAVLPHAVVGASQLRVRNAQPELPDELAAIISDDLLDHYTVAGEPDECAERLRRICEERPEATGIRIQAHPPVGGSSYEGYAETVQGMAPAIEQCAALGRQAKAAAGALA